MLHDAWEETFGHFESVDWLQTKNVLRFDLVGVVLNSME
jgi:hypothetical protein